MAMQIKLIVVVVVVEWLAARKSKLDANLSVGTGKKCRMKKQIKISDYFELKIKNPAVHVCNKN